MAARRPATPRAVRDAAHGARGPRGRAVRSGDRPAAGGPGSAGSAARWAGGRSQRPWLLATPCRKRPGRLLRARSGAETTCTAFTRGECGRGRARARAAQQARRLMLVRAACHVPGAITPPGSGASLDSSATEIERISGYPPVDFVATRSASCWIVLRATQRISRAVPPRRRPEKAFVASTGSASDGDPLGADRWQLVPGRAGAFGLTAPLRHHGPARGEERCADRRSTGPGLRTGASRVRSWRPPTRPSAVERDRTTARSTAVALGLDVGWRAKILLDPSTARNSSTGSARG